MRVIVRNTRLEAERLGDPDQPIPSGLSISVTVNVQALRMERPGRARGNFVFDSSYTPPVARVLVRGYVLLEGDEEEVRRAVEQAERGRPPAPVLHAVVSSTMADAILLCRSIGVPPPIPPVGPRKRPDREAMEYTL
ncbi:MAG: hypothetical protein DRO06_03295 [Thermoproteota archaeon]|nr:MAG: hypothetical protein DRO06_03295 [Candidatus Korarchaeota archaeon]